MSSADNIARTILEMGQIRAQGLERSAEAQARAQAASGQIWGGALAQLGQLPGEIMKYKLADTEMKNRQAELGMRQQEFVQRQQQIAVNQQIPKLMQQFTVDGPDGTKIVDRAKLRDAFSTAGVPVAAQAQAFDFLDGIDASTKKFRESQIDAAADQADHLIKFGATPQAVISAVHLNVANGVMTQEQADPLLQMVEQGQDITPVLQQIRGLSKKYAQDDKPIQIGAGGVILPGGKIVPPQERPTGPKPITNEIELRQDAATQGTSAETPTAWQSTETLRQLAADKAKEPTPTKAPEIGTFADYVKRTYGDNPTPPQILAARKAYGQADDRVNVNVNGPNDVALTPESIEGLGAAWRILGNAAIPTRFNDADKKRVINAGTAQRQALGQSAVEGVQRQAAYQGDKAALTKMKTMSAAAEAFENKALAQTDIISELSKKVPRTQFPIINSALQAGRTSISGDENATKLANAIETFSAEYAKIMNGSVGSAAASSDASRSAARRLINAGMNQGTMQGVVDLMKKEMALTLQGYGATIDHITNRMGGSSQESAPVPATPAGAPSSGRRISSITPVP